MPSFIFAYIQLYYDAICTSFHCNLPHNLNYVIKIKKRKEKKMKRKVIAIMLAVFMVVGYMPTMMGTVLAAEGESNQSEGNASVVTGTVAVNDEVVIQNGEFPTDGPLNFQCDPGDKVVMTVDVSGIEEDVESISWTQDTPEGSISLEETSNTLTIDNIDEAVINNENIYSCSVNTASGEFSIDCKFGPVGFGGNDGNEEGPVWPGVNSVIHVNGEVAREMWVDADSNPLQFQCAEGDEVTVHVDLSEDSIFEDAQVSWEKWAGDSNENLGSGDTCTINVTTDDIDCNLYVCKIRTVNDEQWTYKFAPCTEVEDDGPGYEIPEDTIIAEYWFVTRSGQYNYFPISIPLEGVDSTTTLQELVDEYGEAISGLHYKDEDLVFDYWEITSGEGNIEIGNCGGGFSLNVGARYADDAVAVQTYLNYYDVNGEQCSDELVVVIKGAKTKNIDDVFEMLEDDGTLDSIEHYDVYEFTGDWEIFSWNYELLNRNEDGTYEYYIEPVDITAVYNKQPVEITCTYSDNGKATTVSGEALLDKSIDGANIYSAFEAWLTENSIPTDGVTGWAFSGAEVASPEEQGNSMMVAAVYEDATPVYIGRDFVKCDSVDGHYYFMNEWNEVIYVNGAFPGDEDDADFQKDVEATVDAEYGEHPNEDEDMKFEGYKIDGGTYKDETLKQTTAYLYNYAPEYN